MSNQAKKDIESGIESLGAKLTFPRTGFRGTSKPAVQSREGDTVLLTQPAPKQIEQVPVHVFSQQSPFAEQAVPPVTQNEGEAKTTTVVQAKFDRVTFEITPTQRATLTNLATTLNSRVPRDMRDRKINRDMVMRAVLSIAEDIPWHLGETLHTEKDLATFVKKQLLRKNNSADNEVDS